MFANALENWLTVVAALSIFGSLQAYLSTNTLKDRQFSLAKNEGILFFILILNKSTIRKNSPDPLLPLSLTGGTSALWCLDARGLPGSPSGTASPTPILFLFS
jgi:hypothetical protein